MIELDGSEGEGGGQILRTSLALALLTGKPFHLRNVRAGRSKPGLQPQHLMSVRAAAAIGRARTRGASLGSTDLSFEPPSPLPVAHGTSLTAPPGGVAAQAAGARGEVSGGSYHFPIGTAGATGLVLQTVYLPLALRAAGPSALLLEGGTHVNASPCFHFLDITWRPYMELLGLRMELRMRRAGFYPRGGGAVEVQLSPCPRLDGIQLLERGPVTRVTGISAVAGLPEEIASRQARRVLSRLKRTRLEVDVREESWPGGPGTVLALVLDTTPVPALFFGLGARGKRAERVADEAVDQLLAYLEAAPAAVDAHSADQIVLPLALAEGPSTYSTMAVTSHLLTNVSVIRSFIDREIVCEGEAGKPGLVRIA